MLHIQGKFVDSLLKKQFAAGMLEIFKDKDLYYSSSVDKKYNKFTEKGEQAVLEYVKIMAPYLLEDEEKTVREKAKEMVWSELKK